MATGQWTGTNPLPEWGPQPTGGYGYAPNPGPAAGSNNPIPGSSGHTSLDAISRAQAANRNTSGGGAYFAPGGSGTNPYAGGGQWGQSEGYQYRYNEPGLMDLEGLYSKFIARPTNFGPGGADGSGSGGSSGGGAPSQGDWWLNHNPITERGIGSGGSGGLAAYAEGRDYQDPADYMKAYLASLDPTKYSDELRQYADSFDPNAASAPLREFLKNFDPTGGMTPYFEQRLGELRADPFNDQILAARREGAFADMEEDRNIQKRRLVEDMAGRGHAESSGAVQEALANLDRNFDRQRNTTQNSLVQQEFDMRRENLAQADQLQLGRGQLNMQGQQIAAGLTGQVGDLMSQGLGMQNSLRIALGQMGLEEQSQQSAIIGKVSELMASGMQMQDALHMAIATNQTQEMGVRGQYATGMAGAEANVYGSRMSYLGQLAQARATSGAASAANELGWARFGQEQERDRLDYASKMPYFGTQPQEIINNYNQS